MTDTTVKSSHHNDHSGSQTWGYIVVAIATILMVGGWGTYMCYGAFFDSLQTEFGWSRSVTSGAFSASMPLAGFLGILAGRLTDRFGASRVLTVCGILVGLGYFTASRITNLWQLYAAYIIIALGISGFWSPLVSLVARWFDRKRGIMTGIVVSGIGIGTLVMVLVISTLIEQYNWRTAYVIAGVSIGAVTVVGAQLLRTPPRQRATILSDISPGLPEIPFSEALSTRQFWMTIGLYLLYGAALLSLTVHITPHALDLGYAPVAAASFLAVTGGLSIAGRMIMGYVSDRIGIGRSLVIMLVAMTLSLVALPFSRDTVSLYAVMVVFGFSYGGISMLQSVTSVRLFGLSAVGVIVGCVSCAYTIGGAAGPVLVGYLYDSSGSYGTAFLICAMMSAGSLVLALLLNPRLGKTGGNNEP